MGEVSGGLCLSLTASVTLGMSPPLSGTTASEPVALRYILAVTAIFMRRRGSCRQERGGIPSSPRSVSHPSGRTAPARPIILKEETWRIGEVESHRM